MISESHLNLAKGAFKLISGSGVAKIVHQIIDNNVASESTLDTVKIWSGTAVIVGVICKHTSAYIDTVYYENVTALREIKEQFSEIKNSETK